MIRRPSLFIVLFLLTLVGAGGVTFYWRQSGDLSETIPMENIARLYAVSYPDLDGKMQSLEQWRGRVLVVNYWATWCPPCRVEMPGFSRLQDKYGADGDARPGKVVVQFVGIAFDSLNSVREYVFKTPVSYPLLIGGEETLEFSKLVGNPEMRLPYTLVLDAKGQPVFSRVGLLEEEKLERLLLPLLGEQ